MQEKDKPDSKLPKPCQKCDNRVRDDGKGIVSPESPCMDGFGPPKKGHCDRRLTVGVTTKS